MRNRRRGVRGYTGELCCTGQRFWFCLADGHAHVAIEYPASTFNQAIEPAQYLGLTEKLGEVKPIHNRFDSVSHAEDLPSIENLITEVTPSRMTQLSS